MATTGRKRLRNRGGRTSYGSTFLGQTDPSASTSRTPETVPESQIPSVPYVPQAPYDPHAYYPQPYVDPTTYFTYEEGRDHQQPHDQQPQHPQQPPQPAQPAPEQVPYEPPEEAPAVPGLHPDLMVPPDAPYARYSVEDILRMPGREGLPVLDPYLRSGTTW
ncbi:uncharacterized protein LOC130509888 [Raphanus sativus]|uniref:Uncharacterized protein LOC130509888 n=1 Tax=Raphanus sativus TaxID=3726 RepID=A0A9W3DEA9_RAPSA|nr:uncharacterized protein LOC130509888 [Raphanus sativus]